MKSHFRMGDYNQICSRTGFKVKASQTRKEWTGHVVRGRSWERRHPQDFVTGVPDHQNVPDPRPGGTDKFGEVETTLSGDEASGQTVLSVTTTTGFSNGLVIVVYLDDDTMHTSSIASFDAGTVTINHQLPTKASSGNTVTVIKAAPTH